MSDSRTSMGGGGWARRPIDSSSHSRPVRSHRDGSNAAVLLVGCQCPFRPFTSTQILSTASRRTTLRSVPENGVVVAAHTRSEASRAAATRLRRATFSARFSSSDMVGRSGNAKSNRSWIGTGTKDRTSGASQHGGPTSSFNGIATFARSVSTWMSQRPRRFSTRYRNGPADVSSMVSATRSATVRRSSSGVAMARSISVENRPAVPANSFRSAVPPLNTTRSNIPAAWR
ncbi:unannotated protein [freshwater metagenome]|uniref:Unannotated protein n=1 Tax=freshwater metagenome TaxID=449393 RepID=A0A6J7UNC0_9ZZZZ